MKKVGCLLEIRYSVYGNVVVNVYIWIDKIFFKIDNMGYVYDFVSLYICILKVVYFFKIL